MSLHLADATSSMQQAHHAMAMWTFTTITVAACCICCLSFNNVRNHLRTVAEALLVARLLFTVV